MLDYLEKEIGMEVYRELQEFTFNDKLFFIGHGDGLGPNDKGYKRMKKSLLIHSFSGAFAGYILILGCV